MSVSPSLTSDEQLALTGASIVTRYLSPIPDTVIATARINQAVFAYPVAQLTVDGTSSWTSVAAGMTVYVGSTSGTHDKGIFRVRKAGNSTTLFIGEESSSDPGLIPQSIRTAGFADNDYITVLQRWDLWSVLPRINPTTAVIYEDYDLTYSNFNTTPPPLTYIYINGRRNHYFDYIETSTLAITAVASVIKWPTSSGSSVGYVWTVPGSWTGVSGSTTATLTATVPPGNYILKCMITDSIGGAFTRISYVNIHDASNNPPLLISNQPKSDTRDRVGRRMSFDLYDNRLASIPDGAAVGYFEVVSWGRKQAVTSAIALAGDITNSQTSFDVADGTLVHVGDVLKIGTEWLQVAAVATNTLTVIRGFASTTAASHLAAAPVSLVQYAYNDVPTATKQFVGWIQRVEREGSEGLRQAAIDIIGPANALALLNSTSQLIQVNASPTTWQQAVASLMSASFMAWYMLQWRVGNLLRLFNFTTFSTDPAGQRLPQWQIDKGSVLQQIQQLATDRGNFGANSEGEFFFLRLPQMIDYVDRSGVVVRDSLDASIYNSVQITEEKMNRVSQVRGEAFSWDGSAVLPIPYYSDAPQSPGQGGSQIKLLSQVGANQATDNVLTENWYAYKNNPYPSVVTVVQGNRDVIEPAELPFMVVRVPDYLDPSASTNDGTITWERNCIPLSVNKKHNADSTVDIEIVSEAETAGFGAVAVPVPVGNTSVYTPPNTPPPSDPPSLPSGGIFSIPIPTSVPPTVPASGGPTVVPGLGAYKNSTTKAYRTYNIVTATGDSDWDDVTPPDAFSRIVMLVMDEGTPFSRGAYCLSTDNTDSVVSYTNDVFVDTPTWITTGMITGACYEIRSTRGVPGEVYCVGNVVTPDGCADDWQIGTGTETGRTDNTITADAVFAGGNWRVTILTNAYPSNNPPADSNCRTIGVAVTGATTGTSSWMQPGKVYPGEAVSGLYTGQCCWLLDLPLSGPASVVFTLSDDSGLCGDCGGTASPTFSVQSTDYAASFLSPQTFGTTTDMVGFDVGPKGLITLAGDVEEVVEAFGGVYAQETRAGTLTGSFPIAIKIPDLRVGNSSLTNISGNPSYFFQTAVLVGGVGFFKVLSGVSSMSPSVGGFKPVGVSPNGADSWHGKTWMAIGDVDNSGITRYLFITRSTGASWTHVTKPAAVAIHARRLSLLGNQWILSLGSNGVEYSNDYGVTWVSKGSIETIYAGIFG